MVASVTPGEQRPTPEPLSDERLAEIHKRAEAAYPGPWRWRGNTEARHMRLQSPDQGGMTVMDFDRWGMQGAQPRFAINRMMHKAEELVVYEVAAWSADIYRKDLVGIDHPDAEFIAHAREDIPALLAEVDRLRAELAKYVGQEPTLADEALYAHGEKVLRDAAERLVLKRDALAADGNSDPDYGMGVLDGYELAAADVRRIADEGSHQ